MRYLSLCSGIEAASVAWAPLGWQPVAFAEIEPFPSAVLKHHYPDVPNLGDITKFKEWPDLGTVDLICGGTPCQSFSVAGLRKGLADPRGNLSLTFLAIVDRYRPRYVVWENVPGVLSSDGGRDFAAFLGGLGQLGYGWCYRVLDAQYVRVDGHGRAVPQRRRRVFVVGYLGDWRRAAAVLSEPESVLGDSPPRREAGQGTARSAVESVVGSLCADSHPGAYTGQDAYTGRLVAHALRAEGFDASEDGTGRGTPLVPIAIQERAISENADAGPDGVGVRQDGAAYTLEARQVPQAVAFDTTQITSPGNYSQPKDGDPCHPLASGAHPPAVVTGWAVRRLMPVECERLQGFPDGYTDIPFRGKRAADGPRYKSLGNSMACNVVRWIGRRIQMVEEIADSILAEGQTSPSQSEAGHTQSTPMNGGPRHAA